MPHSGLVGVREGGGRREERRHVQSQNQVLRRLFYPDGYCTASGSVINKSGLINPVRKIASYGGARGFALLLKDLQSGVAQGFI